MMRTTSLARFLLPFYGSYSITSRSIALPVQRGKYINEQMTYIKSATECKIEDWTMVKSNILNIPGSVNQKNIDGVLLKTLINNKQLDAAVSFADHLKTSGELNLGSINSLLALYHVIGLEGELQDKDKCFILDSFNDLYDKYKVLDSTTCERLLHALCVIDEWKKALKVLDDIHLSSKPTHSAYSTLVAMFFKLNKKAEALKLIEKSINNDRPLLHIAYKAWIDYIVRKYKNNRTIVKYLEEICLHISRNCIVMSMETAEEIRKTYSTLGWKAEFTEIRKQNGQCVTCKECLDCLKLSDEEFLLLQQNVKDKLIVGSDLFLKTSPDELKSFLKYVEDTAPYDIVLDALNIAFAVGKAHNSEKVKILSIVVEHFRKQNKKILLIGRKYMLQWPKMTPLLNRTCGFFIDDLSQDDPFFITAAVLSGPHTDLVSKDLLRGHRFNLQGEQLRYVFQRWQWQHQWMVFIGNNRKQPVIQPPLRVTPCAQRRRGWHLPHAGPAPLAAPHAPPAAARSRGGAPDWSAWLCLAPNTTHLDT